MGRRRAGGPLLAVLSAPASVAVNPVGPPSSAHPSTASLPTSLGGTLTSSSPLPLSYRFALFSSAPAFDAFGDAFHPAFSTASISRFWRPGHTLGFSSTWGYTNASPRLVGGGPSGRFDFEPVSLVTYSTTLVFFFMWQRVTYEVNTNSSCPNSFALLNFILNIQVEDM